jgi:hypothetical protein
MTHSFLFTTVLLLLVWGYHTASLRLVVNKNQRTLNT